MEKRFRVFVCFVILLVCGLLAGLGWSTYAGLRDTANRLDTEDRAAFAEMAERMADMSQVTGVKVQVASTMGDYDRYVHFDKTLLTTMTYASHEFLWQGGDKPDTNISITVTLYKLPRHAALKWLYELSDNWLGTSYMTAVEDVMMYLDNGILRVQYRESSFCVLSEEIADWIYTRMAEGEKA